MQAPITPANGWKRRSDDMARSTEDHGDRFAVTLISPPGYVHSGALFEVAETVHYGLLALGYDSILTTRLREQGRRSILFGAHLLGRCDFPGPKPDSIVYNFEQIEKDSALLNSPYMDLLRSHRVWDYSQPNIDVLARTGVRNVAHLPVGWMPQLERISPAAPDIDVLFYGSINERRKKIIDQLNAHGVAVACVFGVYGKQRDAMIARSKIVLNMHYYESKIFEIARVSYLLGNGVCVVSEQGLDPVEDQFHEGVAFSSYDDLVATCLRLLANDAERETIAARGKQVMQALREDAFLRDALQHEATQQQLLGKTVAKLDLIPKFLNIGSGKDWKEEALNLDIETEWGPDIIYDLNNAPPAAGVDFASKRFGNITLTEDHFELIQAFDVLEHIPNLTTAMTTCLTWLKVGGIFRVNVPYDLSWGAWQDPTHVRAFNERSWLYYTDWYWYLGWNSWRFDLTSLTYCLSEVGKKLQDKQTPLDELIRVPRAVDSMLVDLRKRELTPEEHAFLAARRPGLNSPARSLRPKPATHE